MAERSTSSMEERNVVIDAQVRAADHGQHVVGIVMAHIKR
jgi:hypothetical protein